MNEWNTLSIEQRKQFITDHYNKVIVSQCSDCKEPMTEMQFYMTLDDIPGVCPMCVERAIKLSMGIEDDGDDWDEHYRL